MMHQTRGASLVQGTALNFDDYEPATKEGTQEMSEISTSVGGSDAESEPHTTSWSLESKGSAQQSWDGDTTALWWFMGALSCAQGLNASENSPWGWKGRWSESKPRRRRATRRAASCMPSLGLNADSGEVPSSFAPPPGLVAPPPGLSPPPGLLLDMPPPPGLAPPGVTKPTVAQPAPELPVVPERPPGPFDPAAFRRELVSTLRELSASRSVAGAVRRVRAQRVPKERQAAEFADLLTRAAEERRGATRRLWWAFAAGLAAGVDAPGGSAFDVEECAAGLKAFFQDAFADLCEEAPRLPTAARAELLPTMRGVFPKKILEAAVPSHLLRP